MKTITRTKLFIISLLIMVSMLFGYTQHVHNGQNNRIYKVAFRFIPQKIGHEFHSINEVRYLLNQLHETVFIQNASSGFRSNILESWKIKNKHKVFHMCIRPKVYFSNGATFTAKTLKKNLDHFIKLDLIKSPLAREIIVKNNCVLLEFTRSNIRFLNDLANTLTMAIVDPETFKNNVPVGISPYYIDHHSTQKIILKTAKHVKRRPYYSEIHVYKIEHLEDPERFHEINMIRFDKNQLKNNWKELHSLTLKALYLAINVRNKKAADIIFNCISPIKTCDYAINGQNDFRELTSFLPKGFSNKMRENITQTCKGLTPLGRPLTLKLYSYNDDFDLNNRLQLYLNKELNRFNIKIKVKTIDIKDLILMSRNSQEYDMTFISISGNNPLWYFKSLGLSIPRKGNILRKRIKGADQYLKRVTMANNKTDYSKTIKEIQQKIIRRRFALPLCQVERSFYYPKHLAIHSSHYDEPFMFFKIKNIKEAM